MMYELLRSQGLGDSNFKVKVVPNFEAFGTEVRFFANYFFAGEGWLGAVFFKTTIKGMHACMHACMHGIEPAGFFSVPKFDCWRTIIWRAKGVWVPLFLKTTTKGMHACMRACKE